MEVYATLMSLAHTKERRLVEGTLRLSLVVYYTGCTPCARRSSSCHTLDNTNHQDEALLLQFWSPQPGRQLDP